MTREFVLSRPSIPSDGATFLGQSPAIRALRAQIERVACTPLSVLILGESGSGKELAARAIHAASTRRDGPFVAVPCGAMPAELAESQWFGHERGSFTGALVRHRGYFEAAHGGTLFLDEIGDMSPAMQVKLLRALESGAICRVGGSELIHVNVRVVAATCHDLTQALRSGALREDLFYRLAAFVLHVPALRHREGDIPALANAWLDTLNARVLARSPSANPKRLSAASLRRLCAHAWPGNVRELRHVIERAFILANDVLHIEIDAAPQPDPIVRDGTLELPRVITLAQAQHQFIAAALAHHEHDKPRTARALGVSLKTLYNRLSTPTRP
ncbi:Fis family transcriptional regulator [Pandoraea faecigallinarum]|uniref:Fis family transcriptional regulator n=1 Tax=Pandoraea faecigallinarum TaxID=656179 RepID=A0A0H3WQS3_9BURK|nr:sigma-54 dependent transcriptional regulator [Pandoraea faecigallinarum]AKM28898.1 Fis family transcriptional regulator [Pandoraea faecigallinarum]